MTFRPFSIRNQRAMGLVEVIASLAIFAIAGAALSRETHFLLTQARRLNDHQTLLAAHRLALERLRYSAELHPAEVRNGSITTVFRCVTALGGEEIEIRRCRVRSLMEFANGDVREAQSTVSQVLNAE